ncbi:MAG: neuromedin U [Candidatus Eiseniibacteriota bacterium]
MKNCATLLGMLALLVASCPLGSKALAQGENATELAKKSQNPVGDLVTIPFQFNFNSGGGYEDETYFNLNVQPVIPITLSSRTNLIARVIVPFVNLPGPTPFTRTGGIGDIQAQLYFTPAKPGGVIWGLGPVISLPTATNDLIKTGAWAMGPGGVLLKITGPWVFGGLLNAVWTVADDPEGDGDAETNLLTFQYFVNYNFGKGWAISTAPIITCNFDAPDGQKWTIPFGAGITKTTVFNGRPMNVGFQFFGNAEHPDAAAATQVRFVIALLYPNKPHS